MESDKKEVISSVTKDGVTKTFRVEEVENGYVVTVNEYGYRGEGDKKEHYDESRKYISTTNPLDDSSTKEEESIDSIRSIINKALANLKM
jgi:hypothetical protein